MGLYLMGMHLMGLHLIDMYLSGHASHGPVSHRPASHRCCAQQTGMHIRCGSTAYSVAILPRKRSDTYRHKKTLGRAPVSPDIAGPCPAESFQLVSTQLGLISAGLYQLKACESLPKRGLLATIGLHLMVLHLMGLHLICGEKLKRHRTFNEDHDWHK